MILAIEIVDNVLKHRLLLDNTDSRWGSDDILNYYQELYEENGLGNVPTDVDELNVITVDGDFSGDSEIKTKDISTLIEIGDELSNYDNLEEMYDSLQNTDDIGLGEWHEFDEDFFANYFSGDPYEAARSVYFGNISNWGDRYVSFDGYGNLVSTDELEYDEYADEIVRQWLRENF